METVEQNAVDLVGAGAEALVSWLAEATARVTLWLLVVFLAAWFLRTTAARARRLIWSAGVGGALLLAFAPLLPALTWQILPKRHTLPSEREWPRFVPIAGDRILPTPRDEGRLQGLPLGFLPRPERLPPQALGPASEGSSPWPAIVLAAIYGIGLSVALTRLLRARRRAGRLAREATTASPLWLPSDRMDVEVRESDAIDLPITVGSFRPVIVVPVSGRLWTAAWRRAVLVHELAHVKARDPLWQLVGQLACAVFWFHPLMYRAARQLRVERELAADDAVLLAGTAGSDYATLLCELACVPQDNEAGAVVPLLTPAGLKARLLGVLDGARSRQVRAGAIGIASVLGAFAFVPVALALPARQMGSSDAAVSAGDVVGRVVDSAAKPVADAEVVFRFQAFGVRTSAVRSDDDGWFRYPDEEFPRSEFTVYVRKGRAAGRKGVLAIPFGTSLPITVELREANVVSGRVTGTNGTPVAGAAVQILGQESTSPPPGRQVLARSGPDGVWQIDGVLYGRFEVLVQAPWGVAARRQIIVDDKDLPGVDVTLATAWPITGWLHDSDGQPLAGVKVQAGSSSYSMGPSGWHFKRLPAQRYLDWDETAADGSYRLLQRGRLLQVRAKSRDGRPLYAEFNDGGETLWFERGRGEGNPAEPKPASAPRVTILKPLARVSGVVVDRAGQPVPHATVVAQPVRRGPDAAAWATADGAGRFVIDDVLPVRVFVSAPYNPAAHANLSDVEEVPLEPGAHHQMRVEFKASPL
ncbi:MAG TPA: M56 family metallopeptidase [Polyangia bacterium]